MPSLRIWRKPPPGGSQTWRTFLSNELEESGAADLLVVQTVGYRIVYVLFFIKHDRRELVHFKVTSSPTAAWIWQQVVEATPWGRRPDYLIHDCDAVYGRDFGARPSKLGITSVRTPFRAPRANAIAARLVRSIRRECLDHLIVINERHLRAVWSSSPSTTTSTAPIGASRCKAPFLDPWPATDRSPDELCLESCTTFMRRAGPSTYRPNVTVAEMIERVRAGNMQTLLVTTPEGELVGIVLRADLETAL